MTLSSCYILKACVIFSLSFLLPSVISEVVCERSPEQLTGLPDQQILLSSQYENMDENTAHCVWVIKAANASDVIQFRLIHWFAPTTSDCSKDYVITRDGFGDWSRPLRVWCKDSEFHDEVVKTRTNTLTVELVSDIYWEERVVFVMGYWTAPKDIEIVKPVTLGAANYVLIVFSALIGLVFIGGVSILIFKEFVRAREAKNQEFRQKLNVRRKGISGISVPHTLSIDTSTVECTSYIQLSETPTSMRCSSAWTPSPTRACPSDTPTSGNFST